MRNLLLLLVAFSSISAYSQKCKTEEDPFSNAKVTTFYYNNRVLYTYNHSTDNIELNLRIGYQGELNEYMQPGAKITLKLEDESILEFISNKRIEPVSQAYQTGVYTYFTFDFTLSKDELRKLATSEVSYMQKPDMEGGTTNLNVQKDGNNHYWKHFTKGAECISEQL